ncbi:MAG: flagellar filament capping protein FliD, partial [Limisphaerales bacterium]
AIQGFIEEYNKAQSILETNTASSTDKKGKVTTGTLSGEPEADALASSLRSLAYSVISTLAADMNQLADIGIKTNGDNNNLEIDNESLLDDSLANNLGGLRTLFTDGTNGLAVRLDQFVEKTIGVDGTLENKDAKLTKEIAGIDTQITDLERIVESNRLRLIDSFIAMETAQAQINQQLQFLMQRFGSGTAK